MGKVTEAIHNHHEKLRHTLVERVAALASSPTAENRGALVNFLKGDLLPHATAEERHLYPLVGQLVRSHGTGTETMSVDHEFLADYVRRIEEAAQGLENAAPPDRLILSARLERLLLELQALVHVHLEKEERVYLPMLERYASEAEQSDALDRMHGSYHEEKGANVAESKAETMLDVRRIVPARRHSLIFETFDALKPGQAFVLVNDHDPKPLYYQFSAERVGDFRWEYLEQGPEVWRVRIGRTAASCGHHAH
jgi:uncharacterized protein (DUF2249 family)